MVRLTFYLCYGEGKQAVVHCNTKSNVTEDGLTVLSDLNFAGLKTKLSSFSKMYCFMEPNNFTEVEVSTDSSAILLCHPIGKTSWTEVIITNELQSGE